MNITTNTQRQIKTVLDALFKDSKNDHFKLLKGFSKGIFRPLQPKDFKEAYLSISQAQGENLVQMIQANTIKNVVEFGTSFGISTLFLAEGVLQTNGHIITTELIESKAKKAQENFQRAGVSDLIEVRVGDALKTLQNHHQPIDLLLLDGWKDLYLPLFRLLESNFHNNTIIYVDNVDMSTTQVFLKAIAKEAHYQFQSQHNGKVVLITRKSV